MKPALVLVSHGSPEVEFNAAFLKVVDTVKTRRPEWAVTGGFLERARPAFQDLLADALAAGHSPVAVVPCFLFPGGHTEDDIPARIAEARRRAPGADVRYGRTLAEHPDVAAILMDEIPIGAMNEGKSVVVLVAAGSIAVHNREAVERLVVAIRRDTGLSTRFGYLDQGEPLITEVLSEALKARPPHLVVLPCLLFPGVYLRSLKRIVEGFKMSYTSMQIRVGAPFGEDPRLAGVIEAEAARVFAGGPAAAGGATA